MTSCDYRHRATGNGGSAIRDHAMRAVAILAALCLFVQASALPALAQSRGGFLRDAETEELLRDYVRPIFRAAGISTSKINIYLINDKRFNAFVANGQRIFINVGVLLDAPRPNNVIGVLAHESGHIAGGHLARLQAELANAQAMAILSVLLAVGAAAAGAGQASQALLLGGQQVATRGVLKYQRSEEQTADRAALTYLDATGQSARGMIETFQKFADQDLFGARYADPYAQSHPMPRERIAAISALAEKSRFYNVKDPPQLQFRHDMMRAKIVGYLEAPGTVMRRYPKSDKSLPAQYARTVMQMRQGNYRAAIGDADRLLSQMQSNPYLHELKGDILIQAGRPRDAIAPYRRAVELNPDAPLLRASYAKALVTANDAKLLPSAITELNRALRSEPDHTEGWMQLAIAYGRSGQNGEADLASAQASLARGDIDTAQQLAERAKKRLKTGSPGWLRADDITKIKKPRRG